MGISVECFSLEAAKEECFALTNHLNIYQLILSILSEIENTLSTILCPPLPKHVISLRGLPWLAWSTLKAGSFSSSAERNGISWSLFRKISNHLCSRTAVFKFIYFLPTLQISPLWSLEKICSIIIILYTISSLPYGSW